MLRTWTDTHYQLATEDWLYIANHAEQGSVSLICPGYSRDGQGFTIHFTSAQLNILEELVSALQILKGQHSTFTVYPEVERKTHLIR